MPDIRKHIDLSKNIKYCKNCKNLMMIKYLDNILCDKCEKEYRSILNRIMQV